MRNFRYWLYSVRVFGLNGWDVFVGVLRQMMIGVSIGAGFFITFSAGGFVATVMERATFEMVQEQNDRYRRALENVPCGNAIAYASVIGEAMARNARIAHEQRANHQTDRLSRIIDAVTLGFVHGYADLFSPDWWDDVGDIKLPCDA